RHRPLHLGGVKRQPPAGPDDQHLHRAAVGYPDHGGPLLVHGAGNRLLRADSHPEPERDHRGRAAGHLGVGQQLRGRAGRDPRLHDHGHQHSGDAAPTWGTPRVTGQTLPWTGNLAAGAAATITFSVTVNNPYTGNGTLAFTVASPTTGTNCSALSADPRCTG